MRSEYLDVVLQQTPIGPDERFVEIENDQGRSVKDGEDIFQPGGYRRIRLSRESFFDDVGAFHAKFGLPTPATVPPQTLTFDLLKFRLNFMIEELREFAEAYHLENLAANLRVLQAGLQLQSDPGGAVDLAKAGDALIDLTYVALGTLHFMGLPGNAMWDEVQRANMAKERATGADDPRSKRAHAADVVKPVGWAGPNHEMLIDRARTAFAGKLGEQ